MRVLNLDLDFFLSDRVNSRADDPSNRPDDYGLMPWRVSQVTKYLKDSLNLHRKTPGAIVQGHDEVYYYWRELIAQRKLETPFFLCHVDAHSDLGLGTPSWVYLHSDFLELPLPQRADPPRGDWGLNFASYLPFAFGNRWVSGVDFIAPDFWHDDVPRTLLTDSSPKPNGDFYKHGTTLEIELMHAPRDNIEKTMLLMRPFESFRKPIGEPRISYNIVHQDTVQRRYVGQEWDYVFLAHSPGYTPTSADKLIPVISKFIEPLPLVKVPPYQADKE